MSDSVYLDKIESSFSCLRNEFYDLRKLREDTVDQSDIKKFKEMVRNNFIKFIDSINEFDVNYADLSYLRECFLRIQVRESMAIIKDIEDNQYLYDRVFNFLSAAGDVLHRMVELLYELKYCERWGELKKCMIEMYRVLSRKFDVEADTLPILIRQYLPSWALERINTLKRESNTSDTENDPPEAGSSTLGPRM